jgi:hypothetical protein
MLHSEPHIRVDMDEALDLGRKDLVNLVKSRKLVLLVDLDHTVIHTTNEHVNPDMKVYSIGEATALMSYIFNTNISQRTSSTTNSVTRTCGTIQNSGLAVCTS